MGFFDEIGKRVSDTGKEIAQNTKNIADLNKLKAQIAGEEKIVAALYARLGQAYFEAHGNEEDGEFGGNVAELRASMDKIALWKEQINAIRGEQACPNCGTLLPEAALFCSNCGTKLEKRAEPEAEDPTRCKKCGGKLPADANFCTRCGAPVPQPVIEEAAEVGETLEEEARECVEAAGEATECACGCAENAAEETAESVCGCAEEAAEAVETAVEESAESIEE